MAATTTSSTAVELDLRPRLLYRLGVPVLSLSIAAVMPIVAPPRWWFSIIWVAFAGFFSWIVWTERIVVGDHALFMRLGRWAEPLLLDRLVSAAFVWSMPSRQLPRTVLRLTDDTGTSVDVPLRWWAGWRDLVEIVVAESGIVPEGPRFLPVMSRPGVR